MIDDESKLSQSGISNVVPLKNKVNSIQMLLDGKPIQITNNFSTYNLSNTNSKTNSRQPSPTVTRIERRERKNRKLINQKFMLNIRKLEHNKILNRMNLEMKGYQKIHHISSHQ